MVKKEVRNLYGNTFVNILILLIFVILNFKKHLNIMKFIPKQARKFQAGGPMEDPAAAPMPPEGGAPEQGGGDPLMQIAEMAMQALQAQDCEMAMQVCDAFVQLVQQAQGGGAPEEPQGEPVFRRGGKLAYRIK